MSIASTVTLDGNAYVLLSNGVYSSKRAYYRTAIGYCELNLQHKRPPNNGDLVHMAQLRWMYQVDATAKTTRGVDFTCNMKHAPNVPAAEKASAIAAYRAFVASSAFDQWVNLES